MRILHVVRENRDQWPLDLAQAQQAQGHDVSVLLIHDAVLAQPPSGLRVLVCHDDVVARGGRRADAAEVVDYDAMVRLIFEHDTVNCW